MTRQPRFSSHDALLSRRADRTLDLHGQTALEARASVERLVRTSRGKLVHIITGKGKGVLRTAVRGMLKGSLAPLVQDWSLDDTDGGFRVLLR